MKSRTQGHGADTQTAAGSGNDVEAFDQLYREHVDRIYRFAQRMCGQEDDAKDLVQDTFLNAYRGLKNFRGDAQISTWLYTIASRASIRMRRKRKGGPERERSEEHTSELQSPCNLVCRLLLEKKKTHKNDYCRILYSSPALTYD